MGSNTEKIIRTNLQNWYKKNKQRGLDPQPLLRKLNQKLWSLWGRYVYFLIKM